MQIQPKRDDQRQHGRREGLEGKDDIGVADEKGVVDGHGCAASTMAAASCKRLARCSILCRASNVTARSSPETPFKRRARTRRNTQLISSAFISPSAVGCSIFACPR